MPGAGWQRAKGLALSSVGHRSCDARVASAAAWRRALAHLRPERRSTLVERLCTVLHQVAAADNLARRPSNRKCVLLLQERMLERFGAPCTTEGCANSPQNRTEENGLFAERLSVGDA